MILVRDTSPALSSLQNKFYWPLGNIPIQSSTWVLSLLPLQKKDVFFSKASGWIKFTAATLCSVLCDTPSPRKMGEMKHNVYLSQIKNPQQSKVTIYQSSIWWTNKFPVVTDRSREESKGAASPNPTPDEWQLMKDGGLGAHCTDLDRSKSVLHRQLRCSESSQKALLLHNLEEGRAWCV